MVNLLCEILEVDEMSRGEISYWVKLSGLCNVVGRRRKSTLG